MLILGHSCQLLLLGLYKGVVPVGTRKEAFLKTLFWKRLCISPGNSYRTDKNRKIFHTCKVPSLIPKSHMYMMV
jgi:hypothetical protein